jgi:hypothetical protein
MGTVKPNIMLTAICANSEDNGLHGMQPFPFVTFGQHVNYYSRKPFEKICKYENGVPNIILPTILALFRSHSTTFC